MTIEALLHEIKSLPQQERSRFFEELQRLEDAAVPQDFWQGLEECRSGKVKEMDQGFGENKS